jgi:hypothetical protein
MQITEHLDIPSAEEIETIKHMIKDIRSQYYLLFVIGLGLPFVFWLVFFLKLEEISGFIRSLIQFVLFWLPPIICGIVLFFEEREVYYLRLASERGITHFSGATVQKVNIPSHKGAGFKHLNSFSLRIRKRWYYVDRKTCTRLSPGHSVELRGIPKTGTVFELKKQSDDDPNIYEPLYKLKLRPVESDL